jgi:acetyl/propionyl-CoA carboxylase alpha subunit
MVAKIAVWAPTRVLAVEKVVKVLANTICAGVRTNQIFLQSILLHPAFREPAYTTAFIQANLETLVQNPYSTEASQVQKLLSVVPALYIRRLTDSSAHGSKPTAFRKGSERIPKSILRSPQISKQYQRSHDLDLFERFM